MDEVVIVVESDKGEAPVRSTHKGVITGFLFKEGDDVKIGAPMFEIDTEGSGATQAQAAPQQAAKKEEPKAQAQTQTQAAPEHKKAEEPKAAPKPEAKAHAAPVSGTAAQGDSIRFSRHS